MIARPTLVYVLRCADVCGRFKVGKHTGTREELLARYTTYINPEIILVYRSVNFARIESEFHKVMDDKRIIRRGFDSRNTKTEWYNMPLSDILSTLAGLIKRDEAGDFDNIRLVADVVTTRLPITKYGAYWPDVLSFESAILVGLTSQNIIQCLAYIENTKTFILNGDTIREISAETFWNIVDIHDSATMTSVISMPGIKSSSWLRWVWGGSTESLTVEKIKSTNVRSIVEKALASGIICYKTSVNRIYDINKVSMCDVGAISSVFNKYSGPRFRYMPGLIIEIAIKAAIADFLGHEYIINWVAYVIQYPTKAAKIPPLIFINAARGKSFVRFMSWICSSVTYNVWDGPLGTIESIKARIAQSQGPVIILAAPIGRLNAPDFSLYGNNLTCLLADSVTSVGPSPITDYSSAEVIFNYLAGLNLADWSPQNVPKLLMPTKTDSFDHWCIHILNNKPIKRDVYTIEYLHECYVSTTLSDSKLTLAEFSERISGLGYTIDINIVDWNRRRINQHATKCQTLDRSS
jgi:hypothetical protein